VQFLIDASLPRAVANMFAPHGHQAIDIRDIGLRRAPDAVVAAYAQSHQMPLVSADFDFADIRIYRPSDYFGLVIIDRPEDATVVEVVRLVEKFLGHNQIIAYLTGRLVIVDRARIRVRPPLPTP
jgi:predicted nuclease of predicted toxin-antitoxin system